MSGPTKMPESGSRYLVGIDLGTTNCAMAYVDMLEEQPTPRILAMPQWETVGSIVEADTLPSFYWLPEKSEWKRGQLKLPMQETDDAPNFCVGRLARSQMGISPGRVIASAKSWLCHQGVDREAPILPWHSDDIIGTERVSPIAVSAAYLKHLRNAWNHRMAAVDRTYRLEEQELVITVPASFDEAAQQLTLMAAQEAGLQRARLRLLEEPQAAFYYWLSHTLIVSGAAATGAGLSQGAQTVLICDIGGGTTDFSLFSIAPGQDPALPDIRRIAVSEHLLLGGDNIDLSLAYVLESRLLGEGRRLSSRQWAQLVDEARRLKENALASEDGDEEMFVSVAGEGASLFKATLTASIRRSEIIAHLLGGFLPDCGKDDKPKTRQAALQELGLPFAADSAISRHLAGFVNDAAFAKGRRIDAVLYTGGTLKPAFVQRRLTELIAGWQDAPPAVLENEAMDLAVALGAAWSGAVRRLRRGRIQAGYPRSLYIEVAKRPQGSSETPRDGVSPVLICVVPKGLEPGKVLRIDQLGLQALADRPVRFQLFSATGREHDQPGDVVPFTEGSFHPLPPLYTRLDLDPTQKASVERQASNRSGQALQIDISLEATLTETGVLELYCVHESPLLSKSWIFNFNVRSRLASDKVTVEPQSLDSELSHVTDELGNVREKALQKIDGLYGKKKQTDSTDNPKYLMRELEELVGHSRDRWDTAFLRGLWPALEAGLTRRGRSVSHESAWLYLTGYVLRPGYGYELDEWRIADLWRVYQTGMSFPKERQVEEQWWIMWRRVAGGLTREQQEKIYDKIFPAIRKGDVASAEIYMLAGSLEHIDMTRKLKLGNQLVQQIVQGSKQFMDQKIWALARIASRVPLYSGPQAIVRPKFVADWHAQLQKLDIRQNPYRKLVLFYAQAGRLVGDREFDLPLEMREEFINRLEQAGASLDQLKAVNELVPIDNEARDRLFGEQLPAGLVLV